MGKMFSRSRWPRRIALMLLVGAALEAWATAPWQFRVVRRCCSARSASRGRRACG